jgi:ATP-binding cassette, subfamily B (MDR/TAP), member 1
MLGSFLFLYQILTLYGASVLYNEVRKKGCDPSDAGILTGNEPCSNTGTDVFGAMLGVAFAAQGASQFGNFGAAFVEARTAAYEALKAINRKPGAPEEIIYRKDDEDIGSSSHSRRSGDAEKDKIIAIIPKYEIDSSSTAGLKPKKIEGAISFKNVQFAYPTRPFEPVLNGLTVDIEPGQTVAFVGPRYVKGRLGNFVW